MTESSKKFTGGFPLDDESVFGGEGKTTEINSALDESLVFAGADGSKALMSTPRQTRSSAKKAGLAIPDISPGNLS